MTYTAEIDMHNIFYQMKRSWKAENWFGNLWDPIYPIYTFISKNNACDNNQDSKNAVLSIPL